MAHQSPHVAPLDKTRLCHLPCWRPSPPRPLVPQPSVPYKHTKLSVSDAGSRQHQFCDISPGVRLSVSKRGCPALWHHQPTSERCQTVSSHRGGFESCELGLQPQRPNGYSGETERRREREFAGTFEKPIHSEVPLSSLIPSIFPSKTAVNSCGYLSSPYTPPSRVAPTGRDWLTSDKEEIGVEHSVAKFNTRMIDK